LISKTKDGFTKISDHYVNVANFYLTAVFYGT